MSGGYEREDSESTRVLLEEGVTAYVQAMIAVREFRSEIQRRSRDVLKRRLPELVRAIGLSVEAGRVPLEEYANPDDLGNWPGNFAWLAIRCRLGDGLDGYFGLLWEEAEGQELRVGVVATLALVDRELYERIRHFCNGNGIRMLKPYKNEISFWEPLLAGDVTHLGERLDKLIQDWIRVWSGVGGMKGLKNV